MTIDKDLAEKLSSLLSQMADLQMETKAICETAKNRGVNVKALRKVAREMIAKPEQLEKMFEDEEQLDMFRAEVGITQRKGLDRKTTQAQQMVQ